LNTPTYVQCEMDLITYYDQSEPEARLDSLVEESPANELSYMRKIPELGNEHHKYEDDTSNQLPGLADLTEDRRFRVVLQRPPKFDTSVSQTTTLCGCSSPRLKVALNNGQSLADTNIGPDLREVLPVTGRLLQDLMPQLQESYTSPTLYELPSLMLDICDIARWERLSRVFKMRREDFSSITHSSGFEKNAQGRDLPWKPRRCAFVSWEAKDWKNTAFDNRSAFALCFVTTLYGALHTSTWKSSFPTSTERLLWRISALATMSTGVLAILAHLWVKLAGQDFRYRWAKDVLRLVIPGSAGVLICAIPLYIAARIYLVLESFISFRRLSVDCYKTPAWTQFVPHI